MSSFIRILCCPFKKYSITFIVVRSSETNGEDQVLITIIIIFRQTNCESRDSVTFHLRCYQSAANYNSHYFNMIVSMGDNSHFYHISVWLKTVKLMHSLSGINKSHDILAVVYLVCLTIKLKRDHVSNRFHGNAWPHFNCCERIQLTRDIRKRSISNANIWLFWSSVIFIPYHRVAMWENRLLKKLQNFASFQLRRCLLVFFSTIAANQMKC